MADCGICDKRVAKTHKALACDLCHLWHHTTCVGLDDSDYEYMKRRRVHGFRWFCGGCVAKADDALRGPVMDNKLEDKLKSIVSDALDGVNSRLGELEAKLGSTVHSTPAVKVAPESFAAIVKETVNEVRRAEDPSMKVNDHGKTRVIKNEEVLVIKPKKQEGAATSSSVPMNYIQNVLKAIPVKSCREIRSGGVVVKFPNGDAKTQASALMEGLKESSSITVSEPRKMLPKMTVLDIPTSMPDDEIIPGIKDKNIKIKELLDSGHTLSLVFTRVRDEKKMAVLKMSPEIRNFVVSSGSRVFLGLTSCRVFDRFWATQCRHCQKFGHTKDRCPLKNASPSCGFCSGPHASLNCPDKSVLKCVNCSSQGSPAERCKHSASSLDCPVMISERNRVMENTDFGSSKNA